VCSPGLISHSNSNKIVLSRYLLRSLDCVQLNDNFRTTQNLSKICSNVILFIALSYSIHARLVSPSHKHTYKFTHTHTHKHIQIQTDTHTHTQTHWSTLVHTHTHTGYAEKTRKKLLDQFNKFILQAFHSNRIYI
jgi:hypothetical protein